jgi:hypothetical protein
MTPERISKLESLDFVWNPRGLRDRRWRNHANFLRILYN